MTLEEARQLLAAQANFGGRYNRDAARRVLAEAQGEHGRAVVEALVRELALDEIFGFEPLGHFGDARPR